MGNKWYETHYQKNENNDRCLFFEDSLIEKKLGAALEMSKTPRKLVAAMTTYGREEDMGNFLSD